ncbi:uncharacterized protein LY89DRAFT_741566 [Mollisia scopiformis]|uniref:Uncharacterized protein n=1 Tax=Mollisia scopiformis TaxID=149040 RepID=A0A132B8I3_MOLSC|nr:uncharacterized protein LY89DRAFT_741566 [Mollisia scopiformis]KUJ08720.1 hypothetical protein LY89DRAFT_741566 [Mollisia scopiformis]
MSKMSLTDCAFNAPASAARRHLKRRSQELNCALDSTRERIDHRPHKKRCCEGFLGSKHPTQFLTLWANRQSKPVYLKVRDCANADGSARWYAEVRVLQKRFVTPISSSNKVRARRQASDMACWWILYGAQLMKAGLMSLVSSDALVLHPILTVIWDEYCSSSELSRGDTEGLAVFPEPEILPTNTTRTQQTFQKLYPRVFMTPKRMMNKRRTLRSNGSYRVNRGKSTDYSTASNTFQNMAQSRNISKENVPFTFTLELPIRQR